MARQTASLIGERVHEHKPLWWRDFAIDELAPHLLAVGRAHSVMVGSSRPQIHLRGNDRDALRTPPLPHALGISEAFPQRIAGNIESPRDDERSCVALGGPHRLRTSDHPRRAELV